jgi:hypothetical protein
MAISRAFVGAVGLLAVWLAASRGIERLVLDGVGDSLGGTATVEKFEYSIWPPSARLLSLEVRDANRSAAPLIRASSLHLALDAGSLWRRRVLATDAELTELEVWDSRDSTPSGWQFKEDERFSAERAHTAATLGEWLADLERHLRAEIDSSNLDSPAAASAARRRGHERYVALGRGIDAVRDELSQAHMPSEATEPPALGAAEGRSSQAASVAVVLQQFRALENELDLYFIQARDDRQAVRDAHIRDLDRLRDRLAFPYLAGDGLSGSLLGGESARWLERVQDWAELASLLVPRPMAPPEDGAKGVLDLAGPKHPPQFLIRSLVVTGEQSMAARRIPWTAEIVGLSGDTGRSQQPVKLLLASRAGDESVVLAELDRRMPTPVEKVEVWLRAMELPERVLGDPDSVAIAVSPGRASVHAWMKCEGSRVEGRMSVTQEDVTLIPTVGPRLGGHSLACELSDSLLSVDRLELTLTLSGEAAAPRWKLESSLGQTVLESLNAGMMRELEARLAQWERQLDQEMARQSASLDADLRRWSHELAARIELGKQEAGTLLARRGPARSRILR